MIKVESNFYESGCTMEGKGNRVILKGSAERGNIEMIFVRDKVLVRAACGLLNRILFP